MSRKKAFIKTVSIILSLLLLLTVFPLGVSAADTATVAPEAETRDVTIQDVIAGAASVNDLPYEYETPKLGDAMPWHGLTSADESTEPQGDYSLNTTVTDNGDGTHTMTLYDHPVKYVDEKGDVQDISLEIASAADGSYKTKANDIQTVFPKKMSDGITLSGNGVSVKLTPGRGSLSSSAGSEELSSVQPPSEREVAAEPSEGVTPSAAYSGSSLIEGAKGTLGQISADSTVTKLDSETVSYYYDNRTTLEYSLTYTGFKEDIVVSEYTGQTEYHFLLETGGLTLTKIDESYYLTDENGEIKATLGDIIIFTADERNNALGSMTHTTVRENQQYIVTIHIDADYLKDEKTVYPIRIDPTIEITYEGNGASAIQDVTLNQNSGSSGTSGSLYVGKRNTYGISRTLMKFPGLNLNSIPSNCIIDSAYLEIRDLMCETTEMTLTASMFMGNEWDESTANWSNTDSSKCTYIRYSTTNVSYDNGNALSQKHRYSINITQAIRLWKSGLYPFTKGIILKADESVENGSSALYKTFASYNRASNKPSLKINYTSNVTHTAYGWLGFVNSSVINGWVWCSNHPSESLDVVLTITNTDTNQSWRTVGPASIYRSDVKDAGFGTGYYGFSCSMGDWLAFPEGQYSVSAQAVLPSGSTYTLHASPKTYTHSLIQLNATQLSLNVGNTATLVASATSSSVSLDNLVWSSSDTGVATVNGGVVTAVDGGTATITVTNGSSSASCTVTVKSPDPFHPTNIEYVRIKTYDQSSSGGDSVITTIVVKSSISDVEYFECSAPERTTISCEINQSLINKLNEFDSKADDYIGLDYMVYVNCRLARKTADNLVQSGKIDANSAEYYGIWVSEANRLIATTKYAYNQIELACATVTAAYSVYNIVTSIKVAQMSTNTTQTISHTAYKASADAIDDLFDELQQSGKKFSKENTMWIVKRPDGQISWLETGNSSSGFQHIVTRHLADFSTFDITTTTQLNAFLYSTISQQVPVEITSSGQMIYNISGQMLSIVLGDNGYIVTAYPGK